MHTNTYAQNKTWLVFKVPLGSGVLLPPLPVNPQTTKCARRTTEFDFLLLLLIKVKVSQYLFLLAKTRSQKESERFEVELAGGKNGKKKTSPRSTKDTKDSSPAVPTPPLFPRPFLQFL